MTGDKGKELQKGTNKRNPDINSGPKLCIRDLGRHRGTQWRGRSWNRKELRRASRGCSETNTSEQTTGQIKFTGISWSKINLKQHAQKSTFFMVPLMRCSQTGKTNLWWTKMRKVVGSLQEWKLPRKRHHRNCFYPEKAIRYISVCTC